MKVVFRTDGSRTIGMGHVQRCLTLSKELEKIGGDSLFIMRNHEMAVTRMIEAHGYPVKVIPDGATAREDRDFTGGMAEKYNADWMVADGYFFNEDYLAGLRHPRRRLMSIDDNATTRFPVDILLNQNIHAEEHLYEDLVPPRTTLLLGPAYALVRDEFVHAREKRNTARETARTLLVTLGGADPSNQTLKIMKGLATLDREIDVTVILGPVNPHKEAIEAFVAVSGNPFNVLRHPDNMAHFMVEADLAVSAGGTTCWEMACVGLPAIVMAIAENQRGLVSGLAKRGVAGNMGWFEDITEGDVARAVEDLLENIQARKEMSSRGMALVDGRGKSRVLEAMRKGLKEC